MRAQPDVLAAAIVVHLRRGPPVHVDARTASRRRALSRVFAETLLDDARGEYSERERSASGRRDLARSASAAS